MKKLVKSEKYEYLDICLEEILKDILNLKSIERPDMIDVIRILNDVGHRYDDWIDDGFNVYFTDDNFIDRGIPDGVFLKYYSINDTHDGTGECYLSTYEWEDERLIYEDESSTGAIERIGNIILNKEYDFYSEFGYKNLLKALIDVEEKLNEYVGEKEFWLVFNIQNQTIRIVDSISSITYDKSFRITENYWEAFSIYYTED